MYKVIDTVDTEVAFCNPANLVDVTNTAWRILNVGFQIAFSVVVLGIALGLLSHFRIIERFISPGLRHNTARPFGKLFITCD